MGGNDSPIAHKPQGNIELELLVPVEIWIEIAFKSPNPFTILSLLSTCRDLHTLLEDKTIWIAILRAVCKQRSLFLPSYPIADMSIALLKQASKRPYHLSQLLEENARNTEEPNEMTPVFRSKINFGVPASGEEHFLVPGGRYLIRAHTDALEMWDLGSCYLLPSTKPLMLARVLIDFPDLSRYLEAHLGVRMVEEDTLRVAFAYDSTRVHIYDIRPADARPSFTEIAAANFSGASFHQNSDWYTMESCSEIHVLDDVVVMDIGDAFHAIVWNYREGWWALGPKRGSTYRSKMVLSSGTVIEIDGPRGFAIWRATADRLCTYPVSSGEVVDFTEALARVQDIPKPERLPPLEEFKGGRWHGSVYSLPHTSWSQLNEHTLTFDVLMNSVIYNGYGDRRRYLIRGHRHVMTLEEGDGLPRWKVRLETSFDLPKVVMECGCSSNPPNELGLGFRYPSRINLFPRSSSRDDRAYKARLAFYTLPSPIPQAERGKLRRESTPRSTEDTDTSFDGPVRAKVALLMEMNDFAHISVCTASGRAISIECDSEHNPLTSAVYISDFLPVIESDHWST